MARRKTKSKKDEDIEFLQSIVESQSSAVKEGPKVKKWSHLDLKHIKPLTETQRQFFETYLNSTSNIVGIGSAGTGKSYISLWLALNDVLNPEISHKRVIVVRSNISCGNPLGALPGTLEDKIAPFEAPYNDIVNQLIGKKTAYSDMKDAGIIEFIPTSFIRGLTWDDAIVIVDEMQNIGWEELVSVCTRLGKNSRLIVIGDKVQNDLDYTKKNKSGFDNFLKVIKSMKDIETIIFTRNDIVRSGFVKSFIIACEDNGLI